MRIIAGSAGGIPLRVPGHDLRPTMDMVRGAVFSALGDAVVGAEYWTFLPVEEDSGLKR